MKGNSNGFHELKRASVHGCKLLPPRKKYDYGHLFAIARMNVVL